MLTREELCEWTRSGKHHGSNSSRLLEEFLEYARQCSDPLNVYRYMEEKAICTFLPRYWIAKARLHADAGHYRLSLECLEEARSRCGIAGDGEREGEEGQTREEVEAEEKALVDGLRQEMSRSPRKVKRSVQDFELLSSVSKAADPEDPLRYESLLILYEEKFAGLRLQKQRRERERRQGLEQSWMCANFQRVELEELKIEEKIHENSVKLSREIKYHSMHTPQKERSTTRLNKAMDSVQILKKKRSTHDKKRRREREEEDSENDELMVNSVPVGRRLVQQYNRRVTFVNLMGKERPKANEGKQEEGSMDRKEEKAASKSKMHKTGSMSHPEEESNTAKTLPDLRSL